ncbi:hypothetical protein [Actinocrinis puniceicyclus]|uniref:hypothetical protein n=1 Tax=Actinocrinis puniceicyclus TaxID=977794 RepID=UPI001B8D6ADD|nr:hypothetical protein [Actinocrinis puniceicyclus]
MRPGRFPVFDAAEAAFTSLATQPDPLRVRTPLGPMSAHLVRPVLTDPATAPETVDAIWRTLLGRARGEGGAWLLLAAGCALPKLRSIAWHACRTRCADRDEVAQELLAAFTHALLHAEPVQDVDVLDELLRPARAAAHRVADQARHLARTRVPLTGPAAPPKPAGHPDLVLIELARTGVITAQEAELIGRHRLDGVSLRRIAAETGSYPMRLSRALRAAEGRVIAALTTDE